MHEPSGALQRVRCSALILIEAPSSAYRGGMLVVGDRHSADEEETSLEPQHGQGQALSLGAHQWARAVYDMRKRATAFELPKCLNG
jgi:hypothetical protein